MKFEDTSASKAVAMECIVQVSGDALDSKLGQKLQVIFASEVRWNDTRAWDATRRSGMGYRRALRVK